MRYIHCRPSPSPTVNVYSTPACQGRARLDGSSRRPANHLHHAREAAKKATEHKSDRVRSESGHGRTHCQGNHTRHPREQDHMMPRPFTKLCPPSLPSALPGPGIGRDGHITHNGMCYIYIYIYIHIRRERERETESANCLSLGQLLHLSQTPTADGTISLTHVWPSSLVTPPRACAL